MKKLFVLLMLAAMMFAVGTANAAIAEDPLEGTAGGNLDDSAGGSGWAGAWTLSAGGAGSFTFVSPGMTFTGLETAGLKTVFDPTGATTVRMNRVLESSVTVDAANPEVWASALVEIGSGSGDVNAGRGIGVELANAGSAIVGFGKKLNSRFGVGTALTGTWENSDVAASSVGIRFVVLKLAFDGTDTVATVYVATDGDTIDIDDPTTFTGTATITLTGSVTFDGVNIYAYHGGTTSNGVDEIRVAASYSQLISGSTATKPEPGNNAPLVAVDDDISWQTPGEVVPDSYTLYLRAGDPNFAAGGNIVDGDSVTPVAPRTTYPLDTLAFETTYFWRVDVVAGVEKFEGSVWRFTTAPATPVVTVDPVSQTVAAGTEVILTIEQQNGTSFKWYQDGDLVSGAVSETYVITSAQQSDEGFYTCEVINGAGSHTSAAAQLMTERLVGHWTFDDTLDAEVGDLTAVIVDPNDANATPATVSFGADADAIVGTASLSLDNTDLVEGGWLTVPGSEDLYNFYPQGLTVSSWIKTTATGVYDDIVSKNYDDGASRWFMRIAGTNGLFRMGSAGAWTNAAINDGVWHQMVTTYNPTTGIAQVYLDGQAKGSASMSPTSEGNLAPIVIGGSAYNNAGWTGFIDDVKIYSYAIDSVTVAKSYTDVAGGTICVD
ncbi:MAG: hypothetical protein KAS23_01160, partial [Anaerohalosphaera sp.]|nr:hypothetical protein [Anaerohalosphaera sp.]